MVYAGLYQPTAYYVTAYYNVRELHKQCEYDTTVIEDIKHWVNKHKDAILNTAQEVIRDGKRIAWITEHGAEKHETIHRKRGK